MLSILLILCLSWMIFYSIQRLSLLFWCKYSWKKNFVIAFFIGGLIVSLFRFFWNPLWDFLNTLASWIIVLLFLLTLFLFFTHLISRWWKVSPWVFCIFFGIILIRWCIDSLWTKLEHLTIVSPKITQEKKILLVSDLHVEHFFKDYHLKTLINTIKEENPDMVLIAGDLLNKGNSSYSEYFSLLQQENLPPLYAVIGNHDLMGDSHAVERIAEVSPIQFLNQKILDVWEIQLIGISDKSSRKDQSLDDILNFLPLTWENEKFWILISHQPIDLEKIKNYPIDLEVAWHTHNGQFIFFRPFVRFLNDYLYGEYHLWEKTAFITQWIGTRWLPFRLWAQSEIVIIHLLPKKE